VEIGLVGRGEKQVKIVLLFYVRIVQEKKPIKRTTNKMNSEYFIDFVNKFRSFEYARKTLPSTTELNIVHSKNPNFYWECMHEAIDNAKVFNINDNIKKLLCLTDTPAKNDDIKLPYPFMFLDVKFTKEELASYGIEINHKNIIGILFKEGTIANSKGDILGKDLNITFLSETDEKIWFDTFGKNFNFFHDEEELKKRLVNTEVSDEKARDFAHRFVLNFLNFLNNPDIEYVEHKRSEANIKRRLKQGKPIIPSTCSITITGKLKIYIDEIISRGDFEYSHMFWVRGHYRRLRADRYIKKKILWILPFIKGSGVLIEKEYEVKQQGIVARCK
jgi:hypothetical protein